MTTTALRIHALLKLTDRQLPPAGVAKSTKSRWINLRRSIVVTLDWFSVRHASPSEQAMSDLSPLDRPRY